MHEIDSNYDTIGETDTVKDTIVEFPKPNSSYIRSRVHKNLIVSFDKNLYWLANICVVILNKLDHRSKPLNINNFYIEGQEYDRTN